MSLLPSVKICCISSHEEAALAIKYGAAAIGLVGPMPSGPGIISNEQIAVNIPIFLAGGLKPSNVQAAIETVQPFGLDLCSGVRTNGQLDEVKLKAFFEQIKVKGRENL